MRRGVGKADRQRPFQMFRCGRRLANKRQHHWESFTLRALAWIYLASMTFAAPCVIWGHASGADLWRWCMVIFLLAFFAGPLTALFHVWVFPHVNRRMRRTLRLTIGFNAYFAAYEYLLGGHESDEK